LIRLKLTAPAWFANLFPSILATNLGRWLHRNEGRIIAAQDHVDEDIKHQDPTLLRDVNAAPLLSPLSPREAVFPAFGRGRSVSRAVFLVGASTGGRRLALGNGRA
jgi:hypothetical protein